MTKKNYIVLGVTAVILLGVIIVILINKQSGNWTKNILNTNYDVYYVDCENTENKLDKEVLNKIDTGKNYLIMVLGQVVMINAMILLL